MLVLVSYLAARIRPGAATAMAGLIVIAAVIQLVAKTGADMPIWNQIVALVVGPSAALAGGVLSLRTGTDQRYDEPQQGTSASVSGTDLASRPRGRAADELDVSYVANRFRSRPPGARRLAIAGIGQSGTPA
jgi:hypothetical protein